MDISKDFANTIAWLQIPEGLSDDGDRAAMHQALLQRFVDGDAEFIDEVCAGIIQGNDEVAFTNLIAFGDNITGGPFKIGSRRFAHVFALGGFVNLALNQVVAKFIEGGDLRYKIAKVIGNQGNVDIALEWLDPYQKTDTIFALDHYLDSLDALNAIFKSRTEGESPEGVPIEAPDVPVARAVALLFTVTTDAPASDTDEWLIRLGENLANLGATLTYPTDNHAKTVEFIPVHVGRPVSTFLESPYFLDALDFLGFLQGLTGTENPCRLDVGLGAEPTNVLTVTAFDDAGGVKSVFKSTPVAQPAILADVFDRLMRDGGFTIQGDERDHNHQSSPDINFPQ